MNGNNGWSVSSSAHVTFGYDSSGCFNSLCTKIDAQDGTNAYALKSTDISAYSALKIQFDVSTDDLESGESCRVYYAYDSTFEKTVLAALDPPDTSRNFYANNVYTLPSAVSKSTVYIWLEAYTADTSSSDRCYWNNVILSGIPETPTETSTTSTTTTTTTSTTSTTDAPTDIPTPSPTDIPTDSPTDSPTDNPTPAPSDVPTACPTAPPTDAPTEEANAAVDEDEGEDEQGNDDEDNKEEEPSIASGDNTDLWSSLEDNLLVIFLLFIGLICCLGLFLMFIIFRVFKRRKENPQQMLAKQVEVETVPEDTGVNDTGEVGPGYMNAMLSSSQSQVPGEQKEETEDEKENEEKENEERMVVPDEAMNEVVPGVSDVVGEREMNSDDEDEKMYAKKNDHVIQTPGDVYALQTPGDSGAKTGTCSDCQQVKEGWIFDDDGQFYCIECWKVYAEQEAE